MASDARDRDSSPLVATSVEEVRLLRQISTEINATLELDEILDVALRTMDELFGFKHALILLLHESGQYLEVAASRGYDGNSAGARVPVGIGVIGMVAKKRRMMRVTNLAQQRMYLSATRRQMEVAGRGEELSELPELPGLPNSQSQIAIPMLIKDELVGVFSVETPAMLALSEHDEVLVSIVANQAAAAIHNARLFGELQTLNATLEQRVVERTEALQQANHELQQAQAQLVHSGKMASIGMLAAGVAHELNTPIASVISAHDTLARAIERLLRMLEDDGAADRLERLPTVLKAIGGSGSVIGNAAARVDEITRKLRAFTQLDAAELKKVDVNEGIRDTLTLMRAELADIDVEQDLADLPRIAVYPGALNQVVLNLVRNARQALAAGGTIGVRTALEGDRVLIEVRDDGRGIEAERLPTLFEPRFTTRGNRISAGMGLSICERIVDQHQGEISVESTPGEGSTFTVALPIDLDRRLRGR